MKNSNDVVEADLSYICKELEEELMCLSGQRILITGGAGFLGYYLVQCILYWNSQNYEKEPINVVVYDNFIRGTPKWLEEIKKDKYLNVIKYDVIDPLPKDIGDFEYIIHSASIASPRYSTELSIILLIFSSENTVDLNSVYLWDAFSWKFSSCHNNSHQKAI